MATPKSVIVGEFRVTVKLDREWDEWQVRTYFENIRLEKWTYFANDKDEAISHQRYHVTELKDHYQLFYGIACDAIAR